MIHKGIIFFIKVITFHSQSLVWAYLEFIPNIQEKQGPSLPLAYRDKKYEMFERLGVIVGEVTDPGVGDGDGLGRAGFSSRQPDGSDSAAIKSWECPPFVYVYMSLVPS